MRIELRDASRQRVGRVDVDPAARPTRATTTDTGREVFLTWDTAVDDAGQLRRCVHCGCPDLFHEKAFPQVTGIVVVLAFAGAIAGILGFAANVPVLAAMVLVLVLDVGILLFSRRRLVCYRCRTSYHGLPIARYHRRWDRSIAARHAASEQPAHPVAAATAAPEGVDSGTPAAQTNPAHGQDAGAKGGSTAARTAATRPPRRIQRQEFPA